jgi:threonine/homoserine/homoserine lactone efflux protein
MNVEHTLLAFAIAAGLLTITPGLDTALVLRTAAVEGPRKGLLAGAGVCVGCLAWGLAASVGLGALLAVSHLAYGVLRIAGACYLMYLGGRMFFRRSHSVPETEDSELLATEGVTLVAYNRQMRWFARGLFTNLLNPKVGVFYITFLPQFVPRGVNIISFSMLLAVIHAIEGMLWFLALTHATRLFSGWLRRPQVARTLDRVTGTILFGFGLELVLDHRR